MTQTEFLRQRTNFLAGQPYYRRHYQAQHHSQIGAFPQCLGMRCYGKASVAVYSAILGQGAKPEALHEARRQAGTFLSIYWFFKETVWISLFLRRNYCHADEICHAYGKTAWAHFLMTLFQDAEVSHVEEKFHPWKKLQILAT